MDIVGAMYDMTGDEYKDEKAMYQKLIIRLPDDASSQDYTDVKQGLRNFVPNQEVEVIDINELRTATETNIAIANIFFLIV